MPMDQADCIEIALKLKIRQFKLLSILLDMILKEELKDHASSVDL